MKTCPICNDPTCPGNGYQLMWGQYAAGSNVEHWRRIHDKLNGLAPMNPWKAPEVSEEDRQLREHLGEHGGCC